MNKKLLVFPINIKSSMAYADVAKELGFDVVECSSVVDYETAERPGVQQLPYVTDAGFDAAFNALLEKEGIGYLYSAHTAVWGYFNTFIQNHPERKLVLCNQIPLNEGGEQVDHALAFGAACVDFLNEKSSGEHSLGKWFYAGLYKNYYDILGQANSEKLMLLAHVAARAPAGDVIEIGSLYGRSAYALAALSRAHNVGNVLCVDPWAIDAIVNQGKDAALINSVAERYNWNKIFEGFLLNTALLGNLNYLRATSESGCRSYSADPVVVSQEFGKTAFSGEAAIVHIDGNHSYENVKKDVDLWLPKVKRGGWLIIDDYEWAFGDGPRRIGDELLARLNPKDSLVFGGALAIGL